MKSFTKLNVFRMSLIKQKTDWIEETRFIVILSPNMDSETAGRLYFSTPGSDGGSSELTLLFF